MHIFPQEHQLYRDNTVRGNLKPHVFWVADNAYQRMRETKANQCILVSGESGAGKTENAKHMVGHITFRCPSSHPFLDAKINEV